MLAESPEVLSVFELFNGVDMTRRFSERAVPGALIAGLLSAEQPFLTAVLRRGYPVEEVIYPFGPAARHQRGDPLPWLLVGVIPRLSDEPDALYDEVMELLRGLPTQPAVAHYRALFAWLCEKFGRSAWIERAGSSIDYLGALHAAFPSARFLHIHRDGAEAALSMREHHAYRLPISVMYDVPIGGVPVSQLGALDLHGAPTGHDVISRILESRPPARYFGRYWSDQLERGHAALPRLEPGQYASVKFEDLVARPGQMLEGVCRFLDLDAGGGWIARAAALVRGVPPTRFEKLPPDEQSELAAACRPGRAHLAESGAHAIQS